MAEFKVSTGSRDQLMELSTSVQTNKLHLLITPLLGALKTLPSPSLYKHSPVPSCNCPYPLKSRVGRWDSH